MGKQIISYDPRRDDKLDKEGQGINKWWVTGFNPNYDDVNASKLTLLTQLTYLERKVCMMLI
ncbi:hypothetical protein [Clostridium sp. C8-1-8]|uniref:hypothetical protein n=1 Tax=Clostridium sp. C8-1-8 TaxID=2698831 RepID=UPI0013711D75|nr:hypothetical protein [Clostridium sp. C8-1-8]